MTFARIEKFDLVLIAGDMFDSSFVTPDTAALGDTRICCVS